MSISYDALKGPDFDQLITGHLNVPYSGHLKKKNEEEEEE